MIIDILLKLLPTRLAQALAALALAVALAGGGYLKGRWDASDTQEAKATKKTLEKANAAQKARDDARRDNLGGGLLDNDGWQRP